MELKPFIKRTVRPGEPLTAQSWNDVVDAIDAAYQFLQSTMHTVRVKVTGPGLTPSQVRVVATPASGAPVEAVRPVAPGTEHVLARLEAGAWTVSAEAAGYQTATATVTIADAGETALELPLAPAGPFMPDLFGLTLSQAAQSLSQLGIPLLRLLDFTGRDLPPAAGPGENPEAPVLVQSPLAGIPITAGHGAGLVIALPIEVEPAVEVPSLAGLTQQEAQKALESIGLVLGKVSFLERA
jgi:hypothetical protein